jgi:hypothetical protein
VPRVGPAPHFVVSLTAPDKREVGGSTLARPMNSQAIAQIEQRTIQRFAERYGSKPLRIPMQTHVVTALKSALKRRE